MGKKDTIFIGNFKLYIIIVVIGVIILSSAYLTYSYATPSYLLAGSSNGLLNTSLNSTYTIIGNGAHNLSIEVTVLNGLHDAMSGVVVGAQANIGAITSCTTISGTCFIQYSPPRVPQPEKAILFITVGGLHKNININVTPDYPAQLLIYANITNQSTYTNSQVKYTIKAIDSLGNPAPNGTIVNISYSGGFLSATSCIIEKGICNVTYQAPQSPSIISFEVSSGAIRTSFNLNVLSRIITHELFDFGANFTDGIFCVVPNEPYFYKEVYLYGGENVTWVLNQSLPISSVFVLDNQTKFYDFVSMVQNTSQKYTEYYNTCTSSYGYGEYGTRTNSTLCGDWYNANSPCGTLYCANLTTENFMTQPYANLQNQLYLLNPIKMYSPQTNGYVNNISFIAPISSTYYFIIFESGFQGTYNGEIFLSPTTATDSCYSDSYAYNTTIYGK